MVCGYVPTDVQTYVEWVHRSQFEREHRPAVLVLVSVTQNQITIWRCARFDSILKSSLLDLPHWTLSFGRAINVKFFTCIHETIWKRAPAHIFADPADYVRIQRSITIKVHYLTNSSDVATLRSLLSSILRCFTRKWLRQSKFTFQMRKQSHWELRRNTTPKKKKQILSSVTGEWQGSSNMGDVRNYLKAAR